MKKPAKKKTSKKKLEDLLDVAAEELIETNKDDFPFQENIPKNVIHISPEDIRKELSTPTPHQNEIIIPENTEENDFDFARITLYNLIKKASKITDGIINLCSEMEHPRAYEVAGQLIKATSEVTKDLIGLRKTKAELNKVKIPGNDIPTDMTNDVKGDTYVFHGTTSEILDAIRKTKETDDK